MRKSWIVPLFLLVGIGASGQETETITYYDNFADYGPIEGFISPLSDKEERVSSNAGKIVYNSKDTQLPDSVRICIEAAKDIWESRLGNGALVRLKFFYEDTKDDNDVTIDVSYRGDTNILSPDCLYRYKKGVEPNDSTSEDARITINKSKKWDCNNSASIINGSRNLTYAMLRSIAVALGFGSSVIQKNMSSGKDVIAFSPLRGSHTVFDTLIFNNDGTKLSDIANVGPRNNPILNNFVQSGERRIYVLKKDDLHYMYSPTTYEPFKSLVYMDSQSSLMHYDLSMGEKKLQVDDITLELLNAIGWDMPTKDVEIIGENIDSTGIASAYEPHKFTVANYTGQTLSSTEWTLSLPLNEGGNSIVVQQNNTLEFTIPRIADEDRYKININGDIYGIVSFSGYAAGRRVEDSYRISLELKPRIKAVNILRKECNTPYASYDIYYTVEYTGSNQIEIQLDEEYGSSLQTSYVKEPFFAHAVTRYIAAPGYAWIDIFAKNKYGEDMYTIELSPCPECYQNLRKSPENLPEISSARIYAQRPLIEVYNISGQFIGNFVDEKELQNLPRGIYILHNHENDGYINKSKYVRR